MISNLYIGNGWKSPFPSIHFKLVGLGVAGTCVFPQFHWLATFDAFLFRRDRLPIGREYPGAIQRIILSSLVGADVINIHFEFLANPALFFLN